MDLALRDRFTALWHKYFPGAELPVTLEFRKESGDLQKVQPPDGWCCLICQINRVRSGTSLVFDSHSIACPGGLMYAGYSHERPLISGTSSRTESPALSKGSGSNRRRRLSMPGRRTSRKFLQTERTCISHGGTTLQRSIIPMWLSSLPVPRS